MADRLDPASSRTHGRARKKMEHVDLAKERNFYL
tara:strand:- start:6507 stop:6608 length:102 start_codon:yes stop_codon:yes gene_type:complete